MTQTVECPICNATGKVRQTDIDYDDCRRCGGIGYVSVSKLSHLREAVEESYKKAKEEADKITDEVPNAFSKGKRNAYADVLTLIDNLVGDRQKRIAL